VVWLAVVCYFAGAASSCDEGGGCNEAAMEVAMEVVMIKGDKDKTLFINETLLYTLFFVSYVHTADGCIDKSQSSCKQKCIKTTML